MSTLLHEKTNAAFAQMHPWLSQTQGEALAAIYGLDALTLVTEVYQFAVDYPVDWSVSTLDTALVQLKHAIHRAYPFLTEVSLQALAQCFAYNWQ